MTLRLILCVQTALLCAVAVAHAGRAPRHAVAPPAGGPRAIRSTSEAMDRDRLALGRAAMEQRLGNPSGVIECLEAMDFRGDPRFIEADRAAFLLAQAYLEVGAVDRFLAPGVVFGLHERVSDRGGTSVARRCPDGRYGFSTAAV